MFTFLPPKDFQAASLESSPAPWSTHQGHHSLLDTFGSLPWIHRLAAEEKEKKQFLINYEQLNYTRLSYLETHYKESIRRQIIEFRYFGSCLIITLNY